MMVNVKVKADAIFLVLAVIMSNIGSRYIMVDLHEKHGNLFAHPSMKYVYMFSMAYMGSRDPVLAGACAVLYGILV